MKGKLYLVATPIGNLEDITLRAINILKEADLIAAEDTRHTLKLLNHLKISKPLISYYREKEEIKAEVLINKLLSGQNIALVSDAGTPGISDPGEKIVQSAIKNNIQIIPIPGACALINALITSGMDTNAFCFIGFLPKNKKDKKIKLEEIKNYKQTLIFYEAPHRLIDTLINIYDILGERYVTLAKELTKIHEDFIRDKISNIINSYKEPKGEYVIIIEGALYSLDEENKISLNNLKVEEHFKYYENLGYDKKEIIKKIAKDRKTNKNEIYKYFI